MRLRVGVVFLVSAACGFASLRAAGPLPPPLPDMEETPAPGLKLTLESRGARDVRAVRLAALRVEKNSAPSPFLAPGEFKATWEGAIVQRIKGDYSFLAVGRGTLKVTINDEVALDHSASADDFAGKPGPVVKLKKGRNAIKVEYASPKDGDASVRLLWSAREFIPETVPPAVFTHDASDKSLRERLRVRQGRELFGGLRCIRCHDPGALTADAMPELSQDAPDLTNAGARLREAWMSAWIVDPKSINPRAEMPRVFKGTSAAQQAADVAAYLATRGGPPPNIAPPPVLSAEQQADGLRLYTGLGCIACHTPPDFAGPDAAIPPRVPHGYVSAKYTEPSLREFLRSPEAHFKWTRMPNFRLNDEEIESLVRYLAWRPMAKLPAAPAGDPARGKALFETVGCLGCHAVEGMKGKNLGKPLAELAKADWSRACAAPEDPSRARPPDFGFTPEQRVALQAFAAAGLESVLRDARPEFAERQLKALNCTACHARDKQDDTWSSLQSEVDAMLAKLPPQNEGGGGGEAKLGGDQTRPNLTWVGEKLRPQWTAKFIAGEIPYKPREWLAARMPGFPALARALAEGFALEHGCTTALPPPAAPDPSLAEVGRKLAGKNGGFSCVQCHGVGDQKPLAAFEAPAINFAHVTERLTREYYDRWVYSPQRVLPGTRMPQFADNEGKTALKDILGGDARKQFDAIWNYLLAGPQISPP